jgi:hypothetical protein
VGQDNVFTRPEHWHADAVHDLVHHRQPETGALAAELSGAFAANEFAEDLLTLRGRAPRCRDPARLARRRSDEHFDSIEYCTSAVSVDCRGSLGIR